MNRPAFANNELQFSLLHLYASRFGEPIRRSSSLLTVTLFSIIGAVLPTVTLKPVILTLSSSKGKDPRILPLPLPLSLPSLLLF